MLRYSSVSAAFIGLYNWSRQSAVKAIDYQSLNDISSTLPRETIEELICESRFLIKQCEILCNPEQLTILEYRYGFKDRFDNLFCLMDDVGELAYPDDFRVGRLIAKNWRDNDVVIHEISRMLGLKKSKVYEIISAGKTRLDKVDLSLINDSVIEKLLINNQLLQNK